ncbi:hypothetical protein [Marinilabilia salmonicolor]|uniref:hypothetical protein n=1 Tax=Marinilabilia salmonicolor TaxID=989 RepID=UPI0011DF2719|nr:hypothetical protein [Marinilabilia salmonicolor]
MGKKVSEHLIQTISGFIALDMGIIDLDIEYLPSDNLRVNNESLRKTVSWAIKSNNKLTSDS